MKKKALQNRRNKSKKKSRKFKMNKHLMQPKIIKTMKNKKNKQKMD